MTCHIHLKKGVLDPQGVTIKQALENLGYDDVLEVRSSKVFTLTFREDTDGDLTLRAQEICRKLLANPVIEQFTVEEG
ncbi:MAG: phosphoribosylformylglycinamidine synthase subunit PurS [candidate division Zixibacteria bacterium]|nr:phosphoribosylformylglycinamidine synthase subunit PurS [candidate division Zixibacteria bacterium]